MSPSAITSSRALNREAGADFYPAGAVLPGAGGGGEHSGEVGCHHARCPDDGARGHARERAVRRAASDRPGIDIRNCRAEHDGDAEPRECASGLGREARRKRAEHASVVSTRRMRAWRMSAERNSRGSASRASSAICPAISTPVGPAADDHERQPGRAPLGVTLGLGGLEGREDPAPHLERALERLDLERELRHSS